MPQYEVSYRSSVHETVVVGDVGFSTIDIEAMYLEADTPEQAREKVLATLVANIRNLPFEVTEIEEDDEE
jgi:hypothetical protein